MPEREPSRRRDSLPLTVGLAVVGLYQLAIAAYMTVDSGGFFSDFGPFGARNDHYIRDIATFNAALGIAVLAAIGRRSWRVPILAVALLQYVLHVMNHVVDINDAEPERVGVEAVITLSLIGAVLALLLAKARRDGGRW